MLFCTYFQTMAFSDALYLALPFMQMSCTPDVLSGVGMRTSIFCASSDGLQLDLITTWRHTRGRGRAAQSARAGHGGRCKNSIQVRNSYTKIVARRS